MNKGKKKKVGDKRRKKRRKIRMKKKRKEIRKKWETLPPNSLLPPNQWPT